MKNEVTTRTTRTERERERERERKWVCVEGPHLAKFRHFGTILKVFGGF